MCSTPFGITDSARQPSGRRSRAVLNAFRHHGLYRRWTSSRLRLIAMGAQRLSASRIISGVRGALGRRVFYRVLNAFRHHGLYRSVSQTELSESISTACSTPFGITDYIGGAVIHRDPEVIQCSTPFGITDYIGLLARRSYRSRSPRRAQRLSASRIISAAQLSTEIPKLSSAQRLSASRIISGGGCGASAAAPAHVLNAFRHHGLYRALARDPAYVTISVLNAFRHHGLYRHLR